MRVRYSVQSPVSEDSDVERADNPGSGGQSPPDPVHHLEFRVLDQLGLEIIVLDAAAKVLAASERAQENLGLGKPLLLTADHRVRFADSKAARKVHEFMAVACMEPSTEGELVLVLGSDGTRSQRIVTVSVLSGPSQKTVPNFVVHLRELQRQTDRSRMYRFVAHFGLTRAEEKLAAHLAYGGKLDDAARLFSLSRHTVRNQLRSVFDKVGVRRQVDLTRVIYGLCG